MQKFQDVLLLVGYVEIRKKYNGIRMLSICRLEPYEAVQKCQSGWKSVPRNTRWKQDLC